MKHIAAMVILAVMLSLCLCACEKSPVNITGVKELTGVWKDSTGYFISFRDDNTFVEGVYGSPLSYRYDEGEITYTWPDGYVRRTSVKTNLDGSITFEINGQDRTFKESKTSVSYYDWDNAVIGDTAHILRLYTLRSNSGVQSELRLLDNRQYSLTYTTATESIRRWKAVDEGVRIGLYADGGVGNNFYLYSNSGNHCETMRQSSDGNYLGAYPLITQVASSTSSYYNPMTEKGYIIACTAIDNAADMKYTFTENNTVVKQSGDGTSITYSYFIDTDGLITLSCVDAQLPTDYMWLDFSSEMIYRNVYERNSWTDFMHSVRATDSDESVVLTDQGTLEVHSNQRIALGVLDSQLIIPWNNKLALLSAPSYFSSSYYDTAVEGERSVFFNNVASVDKQLRNIRDSMASQDEWEEYLAYKKDNFFNEMSAIAQANKEAEEEAARQKELEKQQQQIQGYPSYNYNGNTTYGVYTPGDFQYTYPGLSTNSTVDVSGLDPSTQYSGQEKEESAVIPSVSGPAPSNFGSQPSTSTNTVQTDATSSTGSSENSMYGTAASVVDPDEVTATVSFHCNCDSCYTTSSPVPRVLSGVALVDTTIWSPGTELWIGESKEYKVRAIDSLGRTTGTVIQIYSRNHDWIMQQTDGQYTVLRAS